MSELIREDVNLYLINSLALYKTVYKAVEGIIITSTIRDNTFFFRISLYRLKTVDLHQ